MCRRAAPSFDLRCRQARLTHTRPVAMAEALLSRVKGPWLSGRGQPMIGAPGPPPDPRGQGSGSRAGDRRAALRVDASLARAWPRIPRPCTLDRGAALRSRRGSGNARRRQPPDSRFPAWTRWWLPADGGSSRSSSRRRSPARLGSCCGSDRARYRIAGCATVAEVTRPAIPAARRRSGACRSGGAEAHQRPGRA